MEASLPFPDDEAECWFVLRDLKRSNARHPAYRQLAEMGLRVFTPMHEVVTLVRGQRVRKDVPFLRDLLFVRERYSELRSVVERDPTLQFRYVRGGYCTPMTVRTARDGMFHPCSGVYFPSPLLSSGRDKPFDDRTPSPHCGRPSQRI